MKELVNQKMLQKNAGKSLRKWITICIMSTFRNCFGKLQENQCSMQNISNAFNEYITNFNYITPNYTQFEMSKHTSFSFF